MDRTAIVRGTQREPTPIDCQSQAIGIYGILDLEALEQATLEYRATVTACENLLLSRMFTKIAFRHSVSLPPIRQYRITTGMRKERQTMI